MYILWTYFMADTLISYSLLLIMVLPQICFLFEYLKNQELLNTVSTNWLRILVLYKRGIKLIL